MSLHTDLLAQAEHLARLEPRRPRQASLRRAVSTAYYALFHLLIHEATATLIAVPAVRGRFSRAFDHGDMKSASKAFANPQPNQLADLTGGVQVPADLQAIAATFVALQEARHEADYNVRRSFTRLEVVNLVNRAGQAFQLWRPLRTDPAARMYLAALLLWKKWYR
jgi:hypothetical protein